MKKLIATICIQGYYNNWTIDNSFSREEVEFDSKEEMNSYVAQYNATNFTETTTGDNSYYKDGYQMYIENVDVVMYLYQHTVQTVDSMD